MANMNFLLSSPNIIDIIWLFALEENNSYLNVRFFSDYPNEYEQVIYGSIIYNGLSHWDRLMSLRLYRKLIDGDWFSNNDNWDCINDGMYDEERTSENWSIVANNYDIFMENNVLVLLNLIVILISIIMLLN